MPKLMVKGKEVQVAAGRVARMADRMHRLGGEGRAKHFADKARKRLEAGPVRADDVATVIAVGG